MSATITIVGYGNPLRGDDGIGQRAVLELERRNEIADVATITCHQLTPEIAVALAATELAIFIDATAEAPPGNIAITPITAAVPCGSLGHQMDPAALLAMAGLYGHPPDAFLITLGAASFTFGEGLSCIAAAALPRLLDAIQDLVSSHRQARTESSTAPSAASN